MTTPWIYNVNQRFIGGGVFLYQLMTTLVSAGWTVLGSGDGTGGHYSGTGNILTSGLNQAYGLYNVGSWFRIQSPIIPSTGQKREFCFQQGATSGGVMIRIKYSPNVTGATGFTGGSPSASEVPTATDQVVLLGAGTDASPTYTAWGIADYEFAGHIVADISGTYGYSWYCMQAAANTTPYYGTNSPVDGSQMALDVMQPGTAASADTDPAVVYCEYGTTTSYGSNLRAGGGVCKAFMGGISAANWVAVSLQSFTSGYPAGMGSDAWINDDTCICPQWISASVPYGTKGYSSLFLYNAQPRGAGYVMQTNPYDNGDRLYMNGTLLLWPAQTPVAIP
jgi:hypothetical protein